MPPGPTPHFALAARATISGQFPASTNQAAASKLRCVDLPTRSQSARRMPVAWRTELPCFLGRRRLAVLIRFGPLERAGSHSATSLESASGSKKFQNRGPLATSRLFWGLAQPSQPGMYRGRGQRARGRISAHESRLSEALYDERHHRLSTQDSELAAWCNFWN
ncbi:uncharacterized protein TrAtP1_003775 [Trichoderma atroviride]|uniref:uncharacterized protein n=1 Tax=Hypocrea atroviridis TaxID=63577 RepID=UPI0033212714|nr:hypothetical protein TrAtP1_003775 [Trichoderma atroviride]